MAKPRIFVSSTYYDLKHIRASLEAFINSFGYEPVLFESGDIGFSSDKTLDESCYNELKNCHMQILVIGGSYGSPESGIILSEQEKLDQYYKFNSITKKEFEVAKERNLPIFFFVESGVLAEYSTYKKNRDNKGVIYAHVSSVNIFHLLDDIYSLHSGNYIKAFTKSEDISNWLKVQWAHLMSEFISNRTQQIELTKIKNSVDALNNVTNSLKAYTEAFLNQSNPTEFEKIRSEQNIIEENRKRDRFFSNPMVRYFLTRSKKPKNFVLKSFLKSNTIKDFVEKIFEGNHTDDFTRILNVTILEEYAIKDFSVLKSYMNKQISTEEYLETYTRELREKAERNMSEDMNPDDFETS